MAAETIERAVPLSVRLRRFLLLTVAATLGAVTVVLPALATGEPTTISAYSYEFGGKAVRYWTPSSATVTEGGSVTFTNPYASMPHGLEFTGGPGKPVCTGLPAGAQEKTGAVSWTASCAFSAAGTYSFVCTVHPSTMTGTITVGPPGTTTTTTTTTTASTPTGTGTGTGSTPPPGTAPVALFVGGASAIKLAAPRHAAGVHGSLTIASAAAGGTLEIDLLARRGALAAAAGTAASVRVGQLVRTYISAGPQPFTVKLNSRAKRALHARGRLALTVRFTMTPPGGKPQTVSRAVTLRR